MCNFSRNFLGGREIAQEGGEILPKVSPQLSSTFHQNRNTSRGPNLQWFGSHFQT